MLHILWYIIVGFLAGLIARYLMGFAPMGFLLTMILGIVGSVVGGLICRLFSKPKDGALFHPVGFIGSILGAMLVLFLYAHFGAPQS